MTTLLRRVALALALVASGAAPVAAQTADELLAQIEPSVTEFTLDNGMTFIVVQRPEAPVVSFFTYADVGSVDEPFGQTGIAHMFEHMAFKGTTLLNTQDIEAELVALDAEEEAYLALRAARASGAPEAEIEALEAAFIERRDAAKALVEEAEFDRLLEQNGAVGLNAFTSTDQTGYLYSLPANKLELWFATESDRFLNPVLREFYVERDVVQEERRLRTESQPFGRLREEFTAAAYKAHPYGQPVVGHMSDLQSITRTEAEAFFETYYGASNLTSVIVGDVDPVEAQRLAEQYFGPLPTTPKPGRITTVEPPQEAERRVTLYAQAQPAVFMGWHRPAGDHPDDAVYTVLADILGNGRTSRLNQQLVETGDALAAIAQPTAGGTKYPGLFQVIAVPNQGVPVDSVEAMALGVLDDVIASGVTEEELDRAKTRATASLVQQLGSNSNLGLQMAFAEVLQGDWRELFRSIERIQNVTAADVQRVAEETFRRENRTVATLRTAEGA
jgi:predicted Zn-dependent peptidase